jgi:hypothetical protein
MEDEFLSKLGRLGKTKIFDFGGEPLGGFLAKNAFFGGGSIPSVSLKEIIPPWEPENPL